MEKLGFLDPAVTGYHTEESGMKDWGPQALHKARAVGDPQAENRV